MKCSFCGKYVNKKDISYDGMKVIHADSRDCLED